MVAYAGGVLVAGCGLGVNGLEADDGEGGATLDAHADVVTGALDAGGDVGFAPDSPASPDGTMTVDAAPDAPTIDVIVSDECVPKGPENCTNGIDDDCNGLTDCQDMACVTAGYTCVPPATNGWSFVAFDPTGRPACPGTLTPKTLDVDPTDLTSPAVCGCSCTLGTSPSCENGTITVKGGPDDTCDVGPLFVPASGGACTPFMGAYQVTAFAQATGPGVSGGACTADPTQSIPSTGASQGETCGGESAFGAGCSGGQVCALSPSPFQACVHHGGQQTCVAGSGYTQAFTVGTLQDTRGCSTCTCGATPTGTCGTATWTLYTNATCGTVASQVVANGVCSATSATAGETAAAGVFAASVENVTCGQPSAMPSSTGSVMLTAGDTICCE